MGRWEAAVRSGMGAAGAMLIAAVIGLGSAGASWGQGSPEKAPQSAPSAGNGAKLFADKCAGCHGIDGKGNKALGSRDFTDVARMEGLKDERLKAVILDGGMAHGLSSLMPAFKGQLSDAEVTALIAHLRGFSAPKKP